MQTQKSKLKKKISTLTFADVFAGCGGLSLGLQQAGWKGIFAIEKDPDAFATLKNNLLDNDESSFEWPHEMPCEHQTTSDLLSTQKHILEQLKGKLDLLAGGPPCQGFSIAGRRSENDPRNQLFEEYLKIVEVLEPRFLLLENVKGFTQEFKKKRRKISQSKPYSVVLQERLEEAGYVAFSQVISLDDFGVPQRRRRFILVAIKSGDPVLAYLNGQSPFNHLYANRKAYLDGKGLSATEPISVLQAIGDLETQDKELVDCTDSPVKGFRQIKYLVNGYSSDYIKLMRHSVYDAPNSLRLANHRENTIVKFQNILDTCVRGKALSGQDRERLGINKFSTTPLCPDCPSVTVTTLPDDMIHYSEPRILTVREMARLQSFPDWFAFQGKYTTGGKRRKYECPRYSQVGNAVPPLFAEAIGYTLLKLAKNA